jgi:hypothetical protein
MDTSGEASETLLQFSIRDEDQYAIRLNYFYDAASSSSRKRVWTAAGGSVENPARKWEEHGAPFDVETVVFKLADGVEISRSRTSHPRLTSWGDGSLHAETHRVTLTEGSYKILVRRIGQANGLTDTRITVSVTEPYNGK